MMNHSTVQLSDFVSHIVFKNIQIKQILQTVSVSCDNHPTRSNRKCHNVNHVRWWPPNERQKKMSQCLSCLVMTTQREATENVTMPIMSSDDHPTRGNRKVTMPIVSGDDHPTRSNRKCHNATHVRWRPPNERQQKMSQCLSRLVMTTQREATENVTMPIMSGDDHPTRSKRKRHNANHV